MDAIKFHLLLGAWARGKKDNAMARKHIVKAASLCNKFIVVREDSQAEEFIARVKNLLTDKYMVKTFDKAHRRTAA